MDYIAVLGIAVALAMDAFSVSISAGICIDRPTYRHYFRLAFHFGLFQFMMPLIGYAAGAGLERWIRDYDHWVACALLVFIGGRMIQEALSRHEDECDTRDPSRGMRLVVLSVATSIDALAVGLSIGLLDRPILVPSVIIGVVCAAFSATGIALGRRVRSAIGAKAEAIGGVMLILIGMKIVWEHLR